MCCLAGESDGEGAPPNPGNLGGIRGEGVDHDGGVDVVKGTGLSHIFFTGMSFFCGGAEEFNTPGKRGGVLFNERD